MNKLIRYSKNNRTELFLFLSIFAAAAILRFYNLEWEALAWNEGTLLGGSKEYLKGNFLYNFNDFAHPPLVKYFGTIVLYFFGFSEFFLRSVGVIFGLGTIVITYLLTRRYYDKSAALLTTAILAFSMIHINFSRTFLTEPVLGFFFIASFYAYLRITKDGEKKKWPIILGICVALALLAKWIGLNLILAILVHALYTKTIRIQVKKKFSVEIEKWLLKSFIVFLIAFFIIWPMALYPIKLDVDVKVAGMEDRGDSFILNVPTILLSPQEYLTVALGRQEKVADPSTAPIMWLPFVGYGVLMLSKESLLFGILLTAGLFAIYKKRRGIDKDVLIFLGIFMLILWLQRYGFTYRYLTVVMPLVAVVAGRSIYFLGNKSLKVTAASVFAGLLLLNAAIVHPYYNLYYNVIEEPFGFKSLELDQEIGNTDGQREAIDYIKQNCNKVSGNLEDTLINYVDDTDFIVHNPAEEDLPFCIYTQPGLESTINEIEEKLSVSCVPAKEIIRDGIKLRLIYKCE